ncbi:2-C-methyl-D-erythritol 4-phosphate cytidylyltransferase [Cyclobacterium plantarum]|uniref:2-C-methyl-D-erythritol 4-phosphate cytidylyltransferase n=1 Tax=Cyclobacterium plantarum TaxID=2716263 RepID=A0ABX0H133_9BACT|nr:2-C-methyl-D-erythritol 4-phosphate cytidylyltransferase [Cyclobacterium plantarum]NHE55498.1 2-C-methyl-D-erythritol 4-phosphate cytidylyltransferase [Cyclobacterium plantarum]
MGNKDAKYAIIVAGGSGKRMGGLVPKQYQIIGDLPVLMHTLNRFHAYDEKMEILLVLPEKDFSFWRDLCLAHDFSVPHTLVKGGASRFGSVSNGLEGIASTEGLVAIHDGVRPFVSLEVIHESYVEAAKRGSAVAAVSLKDSIREVFDDGHSSYRNRQQYRLVQTPQTFQLAKIKAAFAVGERDFFTDDATVYENQGWEVHLIPGNLENIKLTTPEDLVYADFLLNKSR